MKSRPRYRSAKASRWAWCNSPAGIRHRRAVADAKRETLTADRPPVYAGPEPLTVWRVVQVLDGAGQVLHTATLYVPTAGRCDQHAATVDGVRQGLMTATALGRTVAGWLPKRPSVEMLEAMR